MRASNVILHTTVDSFVSEAARANATTSGLTARSSAGVLDENHFTRSPNICLAGVQAGVHTSARN